MHSYKYVISLSRGCATNKHATMRSFGMPWFPAIHDAGGLPFDTQRHMQRRDAKAQAGTDPVRAPSIKVDSSTGGTSTSGRQVCILSNLDLFQICECELPGYSKKILEKV
jgi:hypothetical protein